MAIVRFGGGGGLERRVGLKAAAKGAKHPAKKHPGKKHAAKKHADKHAGKKAAKKAAERQREELLLRAGGTPAALETAFHHLQRAAAVISLLEKDSGGDLRGLFEHGVALYRRAAEPRATAGEIRAAQGLLRSAEHLGMAGLYSVRSGFRVQVPAPREQMAAQLLKKLGPRLAKVTRQDEGGRRLLAMAHELLRKAQTEGEDPHLRYEMAMAAEGICSAMEAES